MREAVRDAALDKARARQRELLAAGQLVRRDPIERAKTKPKSLRLALSAKCWECQGGDADPSPRWRIGNCTSPDCPLYPVRPHQGQHGRPTPPGLVA